MTDLSITATSVLAGSNARVKHGLIAGASVARGKTVYLDAATGTYKLSDANGSGTRQCDGIALNDAGSGQPFSMLEGGNITIGATVVAGTTYCVSETAGGICPRADLTTGDDPIIIGEAISASVISVARRDLGVTL